MVYDIWMEGFCVTGASSTARCLAKGIQADSFIDAVRKWYDSEPDAEKRFGELAVVRGEPVLWGCGLYDNEADARKGFG